MGRSSKERDRNTIRGTVVTPCRVVIPCASIMSHGRGGDREKHWGEEGRANV